MTQIISDSLLHTKLDHLQEPVEICDPSGRIMGRFIPHALTAAVSPYSREELERRRRDPSKQQGKTTAELLQNLEKLAPVNPPDVG
jgi:hypothetical protein